MVVPWTFNRECVAGLSSTFLDLKPRPGAFFALFTRLRSRILPRLRDPNRLGYPWLPRSAISSKVEVRSPAPFVPSGNKNAALPIIAAALLTERKVTLENVPRIRDCETLVELIMSLGVSAEWTERNTLVIEAKVVQPSALDPVLCAKIRASILLAGPLLARCGGVTLPPPGGDVIGRRRVDTHFLALEQLGATVDIGKDYRTEHEGASRRRRLSRRAERHRHGKRPHGREHRPRHDDDQQRGERAARAGSRAIPGRDGRRASRGSVRTRSPSTAAVAAWRHVPHRAGSHRGRIVHRTCRSHAL